MLVELRTEVFPLGNAKTSKNETSKLITQFLITKQFIVSPILFQFFRPQSRFSPLLHPLFACDILLPWHFLPPNMMKKISIKI